MMEGAVLSMVLKSDNAFRMPVWRRCPPAKAGFLLPRYKYIFLDIQAMSGNSLCL
jgi:hypothetical protein